MPATLESHLTALHSAIDGVSASGVTPKVFNFEPPYEQMPRPVAVTVAWVATTSDDYRLRVRVYADATADAERAATLVRTITTAVDALIPDEFGPSAWIADLTEDQDAYYSEATFEAGREDF